MRVAFVHDWLTAYGGAERVLEAALELYPRVPVYTLVYDEANFRGTRLATHPIHASVIQRLPAGVKRYRSYLPLLPMAVEQFDLGAYDVVISSSSAVAKGVLTRADQVHISYVHSPARYAWDLYFPYLRQHGLERGAKGLAARALLHYVRIWDSVSANRVDWYITNSENAAKRIRKTYRRDARVIYPPVDVDRFRPDRPRESFYVTLSRLVPYKRVDLIVKAFSQLGLPLVVIGDGPERRQLESIARPNVRFAGHPSDPAVADYLERARAFIFAADEDFGIAPVEAQAAGAPVIAYGRGGVLETVVPGETGILYPQQTVQSLTEAVSTFERNPSMFDGRRVRQHAEGFRVERFQQDFAAFIESVVKQSL